MKTCPKCGAENRVSSVECRLCATPLGNDLGTDQSSAGASPPPPGHAVCPVCQAINEPEWVFCMQCGKKLPGRGPVVQQASDAEPQVAQASDASKSNVAAAPSVDSISAPAGDAAASVPAGVPGLVCRQCGEVNSDTGFYCAGCGALLSAPEKSSESRRAVIQLITEGGLVGEVHSLERSNMAIGRVEGDLIFPHDGYMSSKHAIVVERDGRYFLVDQKSRNGTFVRIKGEVELNPGDMFLVGKQLFRFET
ncbi:MAG TPA: zinc ribbon domain-containing protein [Blastocatellia bacterium]|nr:zinc ribbon domain-containing protein [Blastocatellia bacterium]